MQIEAGQKRRKEDENQRDCTTVVFVFRNWEYFTVDLLKSGIFFYRLHGALSFFDMTIQTSMKSRIREHSVGFWIVKNRREVDTNVLYLTVKIRKRKHVTS